MSKKSEEAAMKAYPYDYPERFGFIKGYELAERDLEETMERDALKCYEQGYKQAEKDLGWRSVEESMPEEKEYEEDTLQGYRKWTESERVFVMTINDHPMVSWTRNGKFVCERCKDCDNFPVQVRYWMPCPEIPRNEK